MVAFLQKSLNNTDIFKILRGKY